MAWNEPENDPWKKNQKPSETPPDLDELIRKWQKRLKTLFQGQGQTPQPSTDATGGGKFLAGLIACAVFFIWILSGIFIVSPSEQAVVLRFGKYIETLESGPHWIPRFIDSETVINTQELHTTPYEADMLTRDNNIVSIKVAINYRINNARAFLFNGADTDSIVPLALGSALRQVIGHTNVDDVLTSGQELVRSQVSDLLIKMMAQYKTGIDVTEVSLQSARAPDAVKEAFDNAIKAGEMRDAIINKANAQAEKTRLEAGSQAQSILAEAKAYQQRAVLDAKAQTARFLALLPQYKNTPFITRERLYIDAMQNVLSKNKLVMVDTPANGNMIYLPLDKLNNTDTNSTNNNPKKTDAAATPSSDNNLASALSANRSSREIRPDRDYKIATTTPNTNDRNDNLDEGNR